MSDNIGMVMENLAQKGKEGSSSAVTSEDPSKPSTCPPYNDCPDYHVTEAYFVPRKSIASVNSAEAPTNEEEEANRADTIFNRRLMIAGGFLDIALFTSNCDQLKSILEIGTFHEYFSLVLGFIITSLILQVLVGLTMFLVGCHSIKNPSDRRRADILNHVTMGLVTLITIVNIFISSFAVKGEFIKQCVRDRGGR